MTSPQDIGFLIVLFAIGVPLIGYLLWVYYQDRKRHREDRPYVKLPGDRS